MGEEPHKPLTLESRRAGHTAQLKMICERIQQLESPFVKVTRGGVLRRLVSADLLSKRFEDGDAEYGQIFGFRCEENRRSHGGPSSRPGQHFVGQLG